MAPDYSNWSLKRKMATAAVKTMIFYSIGSAANYVSNMYTGDDAIPGSLLVPLAIGLGGGELLTSHDVIGKAGSYIKNMLHGYRQQ
jgi:hypothetical protein